MYIAVDTLLDRGAFASDLLIAAFTSPNAVIKLLPGVDPDDSIINQLQRVRQAGPIFLDLNSSDKHFSTDDIAKIVRAIREHWHAHGFCIARCDDLQRWAYAAASQSQPLLYWRTLSLIHGWKLLGGQLRGTELDVFRLLIFNGTVTLEQVATNPTIFSQQPRFSDPHVQIDIAIGRMPRGPILFNRSEAQRILHHLRDQRIITQRQGRYSVVRPTKDIGV